MICTMNASTMRISFLLLFLFSLGTGWSQLSPERFKNAYAAHQAKKDLEAYLDSIWTTQGDTTWVRLALDNADTTTTRNGYHLFWLGRAIAPFYPHEGLKMLEYANFQNPDEPLFALYQNLVLENLNLPVATPYWELLQQDQSLTSIYALMAEDQLQKKEYDSAVFYWNKCRQIEQYEILDEWLYLRGNKRQRFTKRSEIKSEIKRGDLSRAEELIVNDMHWEHDWWTVKKNDHFAREDLKLVRKKLKRKRKKELDFYLSLRKEIAANFSGYLEGKLASWLRDNLNQQKLVLENHELPTSSVIASRLIYWSIADTLAFPEEIYLWHSSELKKREAKGDYHAFRILSYLHAQIDGSIPEQLLQRGINYYNDSTYAEALFMYRVNRGDKISPEDPLLLEYCNSYPHSVLLKSFRVTAALVKAGKLDSYDPRPVLAELILEEYQGLKSDIGRHSFKLDEYFQLLKQINQRVTP